MSKQLFDVVSELAADLEFVDVARIKEECDKIMNFDENDVIDYIAYLCASNSIIHYQWHALAGRLIVYKLKKYIPASFSSATITFRNQLNSAYFDFVMANAKELDAMVVHNRDYNFDLFAINSLTRSYLLKNEAKITGELPQYLYMRIATFMWMPNMQKILEVYERLSRGCYSHATPTMFNSGLERHQLSSCFLMGVGDSIPELAESWKNTAIISMNSGGVGYDFSAVRHSAIAHFGESNGVVPWIQINNVILSKVDQGGKRKGSGTAYLCDWHIDINEFIELKNPGPEKLRAQDLFYGLWIHDLFMQRVRENGMWSLMCPKKCPGLVTSWGKEFEKKYLEYEASGNIERKVGARDLWSKILQTQREVGMPFIIYADAVNQKNNQANLGTIRCSNLCTEIMEYVAPDEIASCNLASVCLDECVKNGVFDFKLLRELCGELVQNLNQIIDRNYYPVLVPEIKNSNDKHRPIGIGVQGLADTFAMLDLSWDSPKAKELNLNIFENIYFACLTQSLELAKARGKYESFDGSPLSKGFFQFDLWDLPRNTTLSELDSISNDFFNRDYKTCIGKESWEKLRQEIKVKGIRNSLLVALMPTATSAHILRKNEAFEPFTHLVYARTVLSGQFLIVNKYLIDDFTAADLWNTEIVREIIKNNGSIANIEGIPEVLKRKYATAYELKQKTLLQLSIDRSRFVCQSSSHNLFMANPTFKKQNAYHFYGWSQGIKTGMYYLRQPSVTDPINFALDSISIDSKRESKREKKREKRVCTDEICVMCQT